MFMYVNTYPFVNSGRVEQHEGDPVQAQAKKGGSGERSESRLDSHFLGSISNVKPNLSKPHSLYLMYAIVVLKYHTGI
jgi:hypothetical protein